MGLIDGFIYGVLGGSFAEMLGIYKLRREIPESRPIWLTSPFYWIITGLMILTGGALVTVYLKSGVSLNALLALNIGASAPLIVGTAAGTVPKASMGNID